MKTLGIFFLFSTLFYSCHTSRSSQQYANKVINEELKDGNIKELAIVTAKIDKIPEDLLFTLRDVTLNDNTLKATVQYSGGCVKPHIFVLETTGVITTDGIMDFSLLHKTHNDFCRALLIDTVHFNIQSITDLQSDKLQAIRINSEELINLK